MTIRRSFNETGVCIPREHYMVDTSNKISKIFGMIERGQYFVINRPPKYGKTTTLAALNNLLKASDEYFPIHISFEGIDKSLFKSESSLLKIFLFHLKKSFITSGSDDLVSFMNTRPPISHFDELDILVSELIVKIGKKVVLIIDEVDKSSENQLFLALLGFLQNKYLNRDKKGQYTFHSVILADIHDVRNLKLNLSSKPEPQYTLPWNIATEFNVDMSFNPLEISTMLKDYSAEAGIEMDFESVSQMLYDYTSGHPLLISKLGKMIVDEIIPYFRKKHLNNEGVQRAINLVIKIKHTDFESMFNNLDHYKELNKMVERMLLDDEKIDFDMNNNVITLGITHGIFKASGPYVEIHNLIYRELIYNYMANKFSINETRINKNIDFFPYPLMKYVIEDGTLDFEEILLKFQAFMRKEYSNEDEEFLERNGRLIFLAFLRPILSLIGSHFEEVQISEEKRMDVIVYFAHVKYVIELKIWRGKQAHEEGILQLSHYLESHGLKKGYLVIFDTAKKSRKPYKHIRNVINNKKIITVWV